jgi:6-phosphofructokinase
VYEMKNLLITMSGGTTSVINATLAGIILEAQKSKEIDKIYAGFPGVLGFMSDSIIDLTDTTNLELSVLRSSPGSASIGTTRIKIITTQDIDYLNSSFVRYNIGYFINIGGNGTIKQTKSIASCIDGVQIASAPKTVDNDLGDNNFEDLWFTPGFPSCVNYWAHKMQMLDNENRGASSHDKVLIAETFGRETGFIVGSLRFFDQDRRTPLVLLIPEDHQTPDKVLAKIDNTLCESGRVLIGICEGYSIKEYDYNYDLSGQIMYGSSSSSASQQLINLCSENDIQARGFNPTIDQRQNFNHTLDTDINISYNIGREIIENFMKGESHFFQSYSKDGLHILPLEMIEDYSRTLKESWIDRGSFDVTNEYISYLNEFVPNTLDRKLFTFGSIA